jgi:hypothetical protein
VDSQEGLAGSQVISRALRQTFRLSGDLAGSQEGLSGSQGISRALREDFQALRMSLGHSEDL